MDTASTALLTSLFTVGISGVIGYGLYRIVNVSTPATPSGWGRRLLSWTLFLTSISSLPAFFRYLDANSFAVWVLVSSVAGTTMFAIGWGYGKWFSEIARKQRRKTGTSSKIWGPRIADIYYEVAWKELRAHKVNEGLWARVYADTNGQKEEAKARYIEARARQLYEKNRENSEHSVTPLEQHPPEVASHKPQRSLREEVLLGVKLISASFAIVAVVAATIFPAVETASVAYNLGYFVGGLFDDRDIGANKWVVWSLILAPYLIVRFRQPDSDSAGGQDSNDQNK